MKNYKNLNQAFVESMSNVYHSGEIVHSRGMQHKEIIHHSMVIEDPTQLSIEVPARKFNESYAFGEWLWYVGANPRVNNMGKLAKIWHDIQDVRGLVESNYGSYLFETQYGNQWFWVRDELKNDKESRRATIAINQPYHKNRNHKDYPCTQYVQFFIRNDELHICVNMRSNDAVFGFCNDVYTFALFQQLMLNELRQTYPELKLGKYHHYAGSFHVYDRHFNMMKKIVDNYLQNVPMKNDWRTDAPYRDYPTLATTKLKDEVTYEWLINNNHKFPQEDLNKEQLYGYINKTKELICE